MKLSWKMIGQPSFVTYKNQFHFFFSLFLSNALVLEYNSSTFQARARTKEIKSKAEKKNQKKIDHQYPSEEEVCDEREKHNIEVNGLKCYL